VFGTATVEGLMCFIEIIDFVPYDEKTDPVNAKKVKDAVAKVKVKLDGRKEEIDAALAKIKTKFNL
jgi:hypothetical protein